MTTRQSVILGVSIVVSCSILVSGLGRTSVAQQRPAGLIPNRFVIIDRRAEGSPIAFMLFDNATGRLWERRVESHSPPRFYWHAIGCPPEGDFSEAELH